MDFISCPEVHYLKLCSFFHEAISSLLSYPFLVSNGDLQSLCSKKIGLRVIPSRIVFVESILGPSRVISSVLEIGSSLANAALDLLKLYFLILHL